MNHSVEQVQVYFEDVAVGDELPALIRGPFSVMEMAKFGAMIGDFHPTHYDHKWATERDRVPGVVVYGLLNTVHMSQLLTDWVGAYGRLKKFSQRGRAQVYAGDTLRVTGRVTRKYVSDGENCLDCEMFGHNQDGQLVEDGRATVVLPSRGSLKEPA
jgi:acyl dehydratase